MFATIAHKTFELTLIPSPTGNCLNFSRFIPQKPEAILHQDDVVSVHLADLSVVQEGTGSTVEGGGGLLPATCTLPLGGAVQCTALHWKIHPLHINCIHICHDSKYTVNLGRGEEKNTSFYPHQKIWPATRAYF